MSLRTFQFRRLQLGAVMFDLYIVLLLQISSFTFESGELCSYFVQDLREAVLWMAVYHKQKEALEIFSREVAPAGTGMGTEQHVV